MFSQLVVFSGFGVFLDCQFLKHNSKTRQKYDMLSMCNSHQLHSGFLFDKQSLVAKLIHIYTHTYMNISLTTNDQQSCLEWKCYGRQHHKKNPAPRKQIILFARQGTKELAKMVKLRSMCCEDLMIQNLRSLR